MKVYLLLHVVEINTVDKNRIFIHEEFIIIHTEYQESCKKNNENVLSRENNVHFENLWVAKNAFLIQEQRTCRALPSRLGYYNTLFFIGQSNIIFCIVIKNLFGRQHYAQVYFLYTVPAIMNIKFNSIYTYANSKHSFSNIQTNPFCWW